MAIKAGELREHIEEFLDARIRVKPAEDRTHREELLLQSLSSASDLLLRQEQAKKASPAETFTDRQVAALLEAHNNIERLRRATEE